MLDEKYCEETIKRCLWWVGVVSQEYGMNKGRLFIWVTGMMVRLPRKREIVRGGRGDSPGERMDERHHDLGLWQVEIAECLSM